MPKAYGFCTCPGGVLIGLGIAAGSFSLVMAAFARNVPADKRTIVFGIGTAAGSAGMAFFSPLAVAMIANLGWQDTLVWLGVLMMFIPLLAIPLVGNASTSALSAQEMEQSVAAALKEALKHQSYLLLVAGFFVCGFQVAFITAHFPAYISDIGIDAYWAGMALMLIGLFNIVGSLASGFISQRNSMPKFLALIYIARSVAVTAFLLIPADADHGCHLCVGHGHIMALDRAAHQCAGRADVRHALSRHAGRAGVFLPPDRLIPGRMAWWRAV